MYLKRLELQGFKSFPEKIKLDFHEGITGVVGPNGSGKSNIADAVRWVLGEQRAKSLRGDKMEDVIFSGTQNRRPLNFAEVTIVFDNAEHKLPVDYSEVIVTRRVFRTGESEYALNGSLCRLKDIHELFMDTGLGREGYSIIGQGRVEEILSNRFEDRRNLFEEAAGITKYKIRRKEALLKLEREKENMARIEDILLELESRLEPLQNQAEKAKEYLALRDTLKETEIRLFTKKNAILSQDISGTEEHIRGSHEELARLQTQQETRQQEIKAEKEALALLTKEVEENRETLYQILSAQEKEQSGQKLLYEQIQTILRDQARLKDEIGKKKLKIEENTQQLLIKDRAQKALAMNIHLLEDSIAALEESLHEMMDRLSLQEGQMEDYKTNIFEAMKQKSQVEGDIQKRATLVEQLLKRQQEVTEEKEYVNSRKTDLKARWDALLFQWRTLQEEKAALKAQSARYAEEKVALALKAEAAKERLDALERAQNEKKSRLKVLEDMEREREGYTKSVKEILSLKDKGMQGFSGIVGAVGELVQVEKNLEKAIETALGAAVQNIIAKTSQDAAAAIEYLKKNRLGRATFLPVANIDARGLQPRERDVLQEPGVLGIAKEMVRYDQQYENVVSFLLGRVLVVDTLENGIRVHKKYKHYKMVTLEGELFSIGGAMTGGNTVRQNSFFGRSRQIQELKADILDLEGQLTSHKNIFTTVKQQEVDLSQKIQSVQEQTVQLQGQRLNIKNAFQIAKQEIKETNHRWEKCCKEEFQLKEQLDDTDKLQEKSQQILTSLQNDIIKGEDQLSSFQQDVKEDKTAQEKLAEELTNLKIEHSAKEQEQKALLAWVENMQSEAAAIEKEIREACSSIEDYDGKKMEKERQIGESKEKVAALELQKETCENDIRTKETSKKEKQDWVSAQEEAARQQTEKIHHMSAALMKLENKLEKLLEERDRLSASMWEEYEIDLENIKEYTLPSESFTQLNQSIQTLKEQLKALGDVNITSLEEYREVKERAGFLRKQKDDILDAEKKLYTIIEELTKQMEKRFSEQFSIIAKHFQTVFTEMFGGGKAYLHLTDENDILGSAIEIQVQPPGKNLQSMTLLSGGERALTAIALLFAILKLKPSSFCILDEIEAALDDANIMRFAEYLQRFKQGTQFIVVTHRKGTMEAADILYGVTMQEMGVSKLVSVKLVEEAV